jgi:hypothetical protein
MTKRYPTFKSSLIKNKRISKDELSISYHENGMKME